MDFIGREICCTGSYEPCTLALAARLMKHGGVFVDVGTNFGLFTFTVASAQNTRCIAIDASIAALTQFHKHLSINEFNNIICVHSALASKHGTAFLHTPIASNLGTTRICVCDEGADAYMVSTTTLDEVLLKLRVPSVDLLKLDVEGYELEVLRGTNLKSSVAPKHIIMEYDTNVASADKLRETYELLSGAGYEAFTVTGDTYKVGISLPEANLWWRRK
jgi:FkbM family methyltransferase